MTPAALLVAVLVLAAALVWRGPAAESQRRLAALRAGAGAATARPPLGRRRREPDDVDVPLVLELVASALSAGASAPAALAVVADAIGGTEGAVLRAAADRLRLGADEAAAWAGAPSWTLPLRRGLSLSARTGAPPSRLLRGHAEDLRRRRRRAAQAAAQRLGVRVVLPLGLCALPGFAAWGVVPVVLGLARDVLGT